MPQQRLAIFGGTFDPIHNAHLAVAREAAIRFALDRVLVIPNGNPPHKQGVERAEWADRYRMVELACAGDAHLMPSRLEEGQARSYSIDTIERVKAAYPGDRVFFLIGADAFAEIHTWRRWEEVLAAVEFIVVARPGHRYEIPAGAHTLPLETLALNVSSSDIRAALRGGRKPPELPGPVQDYISANKLYGYRGSGFRRRN
jgi:nicotinate-nucleotide adenylyltransferase